jgi:hypothetical protein
MVLAAALGGQYGALAAVWECGIRKNSINGKKHINSLKYAKS